MLGKYRVSMTHSFKEETGKITDNYKECNKCYPEKKNSEISSTTNTIMEERRDRSMCRVTKAYKNITSLLWEASRECGRTGIWRGRMGLVIKELVHLPGIYRPLNWKLLWSDTTLDPLNSRVEDVLKVSDQLRSSCSHLVRDEKVVMWCFEVGRWDIK